jgi:ferredoxin-type protein NapH
MGKGEYSRLFQQRLRKQWVFTILFLLILMGGWKYPLLGFFIPLCMLLGIALLKGRKWCDWYCPRGSFYDALGKAGSPEKRIPSLFKDIFFRMAMLAFLFSMVILQVLRRWPNPYSIGKFFVTLLTLTTLLGIIFTLLIHQRVWCSFCPIGTLASRISGAKRRVIINSERCTQCTLCGKVCPIQIEPYSYRSQGMQVVADKDCLKCGLCISICPVDALSFEEKNRKD